MKIEIAELDDLGCDRGIGIVLLLARKGQRCGDGSDSNGTILLAEVGPLAWRRPGSADITWIGHHFLHGVAVNRLLMPYALVVECGSIRQEAGS